jgi:hypothetical protein
MATAVEIRLEEVETKGSELNAIQHGKEMQVAPSYCAPTQVPAFSF